MLSDAASADYTFSYNYWCEHVCPEGICLRHMHIEMLWKESEVELDLSTSEAAHSLESMLDKTGRVTNGHILHCNTSWNMEHLSRQVPYGFDLEAVL